MYICSEYWKYQEDSYCRLYMSNEIICASVLVVMLLILVLRTPYVKGLLGEKIVAFILRTLSNDYYIFNDVYLKVGGHTTQIDHVVVSPFGIFVIETKNYKGWIFGNDEQQYWIKNMFGKKYEFYNPVLQNRAHTKVLHQYLNISNSFFIPVVVFLSGATLKCETMANVIKMWSLRRFIRKYTSPVFKEDEVHEIVNKLREIFVEDKAQERKHIKSVKETAKRSEKLIASRICPRCGGKLIVREGRYGEFLGCHNYPRCKFTANL